jgi:DNA-binding NarL/FixJ family response regulator
MKTRQADGKVKSPLAQDSRHPSRQEVLVVEEHDPFQHGVLVVDDCELMRLMMRLALERAGFRVLLATTGEEAIAAVLLDVQMPGLDGPHTLDALLDMDPGVRSCFVSGDTGEYTPEDLIRRGARAVFYKPFRVIDLAEAVHRIVNGEPPVGIDSRRPEFRAAAIFAEDFDFASEEPHEHKVLP